MFSSFRDLLLSSTPLSVNPMMDALRESIMLWLLGPHLSREIGGQSWRRPGVGPSWPRRHRLMPPSGAW